LTITPVRPLGKIPSPRPKSAHPYGPETGPGADPERTQDTIRRSGAGDNRSPSATAAGWPGIDGPEARPVPGWHTAGATPPNQG
jgi:hypothetical protein